jgi:hypothetical protein
LLVVLHICITRVWHAPELLCVLGCCRHASLRTSMDAIDPWIRWTMTSSTCKVAAE